MTSLNLQLSDELAQLVRDIARSEAKSEEEVVASALAVYTGINHGPIQGLGQYRSGHSDTSQSAETLLDEAARKGTWR